MNRRDFLRTSSAAAVFAALPFISAHKALATLDPVREGTLALPASNDVQLGGVFGKMYESGLRRLTENPLNTDFVLADVNFNQKRWFTNFRRHFRPVSGSLFLLERRQMRRRPRASQPGISRRGH